MSIALKNVYRDSAGQQFARFVCGLSATPRPALIARDAWHCVLHQVVNETRLRLLRIQYEAMLVQPAAALRQVLSFGGYSLDDEAGIALATSNPRERPPMDLGLMMRDTALNEAPTAARCEEARLNFASVMRVPCARFCSCSCRWAVTSPALPFCVR